MASIQLPRVARHTLADQVAEILRLKISTGELPPGMELKESQLVEQLSVGRAAIREACRQLIGEGLVVHRARHGPSVWKPTPRELAELYELRAAMEGMCVRLILEGGKRDVLVAALAPIVDEMTEAERAGDFARADRCDASFHAVVVEMSGHQRLGRVWQSAHPVVWTAAMPALREATRQPWLADQHRAFLQQLATASPIEAQEAMIRHIRNGEHQAIQNITRALNGTVEPDAAE